MILQHKSAAQMVQLKVPVHAKWLFQINDLNMKEFRYFLVKNKLLFVKFVGFLVYFLVGVMCMRKLM